MMKKLGLLILALFAIAGVVTAFPFTATLDSQPNVSLLEGHTITSTIEIHNVDFEKHKITVTAKSDSKFVKVKPQIKSFTLNGYESTQLGIDIEATDDADHDTYNVTIKVDADGQVKEVPLTVYVGNNPFLTVSTFNTSVCGNEYVDSVSVSVKNLTSDDSAILIKAEQPVLFPTFEDESIQLDKGDTEIVSLDVHVSPQNTGSYDGTIFVQNDQILVARPFSVKVNDCPTPVEKTISLTLLKKPKDLVKLQTTLFPITLKNLTDNVQNVNVTIESVIPVEAISITLTPNETQTVDLKVSPDLSTKAGTYPAKITATASGYSVSQTTNMKVLPLAYIDASAATTIFEMTKGETQSMQIIVDNQGDTSQSISMAMQYAIPGVDFVFTPSTFMLAAGKTQVVNLAVTVSANASLNSVNNSIIVNGTPTKTIPLTFDVISDTPVNTLLINIISAPELLKLNAGEEKTFEVVVENPTDSSIVGIHFKLVGVKGSGLVLLPKDPSETLAPHQTKTLVFVLKASDTTKAGAYAPILVMESAKASTSVPFTVIVEQGGLLSGLTGFFILLSGNAPLLGLIILLVIVALWVIGRVTKDTPAWASKWVK